MIACLPYPLENGKKVQASQVFRLLATGCRVHQKMAKAAGETGTPPNPDYTWFYIGKEHIIAQPVNDEDAHL